MLTSVSIGIDSRILRGVGHGPRKTLSKFVCRWNTWPKIIIKVRFPLLWFWLSLILWMNSILILKRKLYMVGLSLRISVLRVYPPKTEGSTFTMTPKLNHTTLTSCHLSYRSPRFYFRTKTINESVASTPSASSGPTEGIDRHHWHPVSDSVHYTWTPL